MGFAEDVVARRKAFVQVEDRAAKLLHDELQSMLSDAYTKLGTMADFTDKDGKLVDNSKSRDRMFRVIADIKSALDDATLKATNTLIDTREEAFKLGVTNVAQATKKATGQDFGGTTEQLFRAAAKDAATHKVLLNPTENSKEGDKPKQAFDDVNQWAKGNVQEVLTKALLRGQDQRTTAKKLQEIGDVTKRAATRIVRTNMNAAQNNAHMAFFRAHPEVFRGVRWEAIMDARTSKICAALHGRFFALDEEPPGPPAHPNCRCTLVGVLLDAEEQAFMDEQTRDAKNTATGEYIDVRRDKPFAEWLKEQPVKNSTKITGSKTKDQLFRDGKLDLHDLIKPDLTARSDKEAVERALAKNPGDKNLEALAAKIGSLKRSLKELDVEDAIVKAKQAFTTGTGKDKAPPAPPPPPPKEEPSWKAPKSSKPKVGEAGYSPKDENDAVKHFTEYDKNATITKRIALQEQIDNHVQMMADSKLDYESADWKAMNKYLKKLQADRDAHSWATDVGEMRRAAELPKKDQAEVKPLAIGFDRTGTKWDWAKPSNPQLKEFKDTLTGWKQYVHGKWTSTQAAQEVSFGYSTRRAFHEESYGPSGLIVGDGKDKSTMLHEWGHHLEAHNPAIHDACVEFLERRTQGETAQKLSKLTGNSNYKDDEVAKPDKFFSPYVGKIYEDPNTATLRASEVLSMGLERMFKDPGQFASEDPEYFKLMWSIMQGKLK